MESIRFQYLHNLKIIMPTIRSQILITKGDEHQFIQFIMDYLRYDKSPFLPLFISYKAQFMKQNIHLIIFMIGKFANITKILKMNLLNYQQFIFLSILITSLFNLDIQTRFK